jgi:hypothetical protein
MGAPASKKKINFAIGILNFYPATLCGTVAQVLDDNLPTGFNFRNPECPCDIHVLQVGSWQWNFELAV